MFTNPYSTTPCLSYNLEKIVLELKRARIDARLHPAKHLVGDFPIGSIEDISAVVGKEENIPPFAHPIHTSETGIVIDLRACTKNDRTGAFVVTSKPDFNFLLLRASLLRSWIGLGPIDLLSAGSLPLTVYIRWLSENIARRMGLDAGTQVTVSVVTGYFYLSLFQSDEMDAQDKLKAATQIARATHISAEKCIEVIESLPDRLFDVHSYVEALVSSTNSVRMNKFNTGLLYSIIASGWFGANSKEVLAVAVEHPPTFLAIVYTALTDRSYHRSLFAKTVQQSDKNNAGKNFAYNLVRLPAN